MNESTLHRLEYFKIKQSVMDYAVSYLGKRHVEQMQPIVQFHSVRNALDETAEALEIVRNGASVPIPSLGGIEPVLHLMGTGYIFSEQDFMNIQLFLHSCSQLKKYMAAKSLIAPRVSSFAASMHELVKLKAEIERCIRNGRVTDESSKELNKVRKKIAVTEERIKSKLDAIMSRHRTILQENVVSMRGGRYVFLIKKEHRKRLPGSVLDESASGQTVYIEPQEIAHLQVEISSLRAEESREETKVLSYLTGLTEADEYELRMNVETVGVYDFLFAKARYAHAIGGGNVELNNDGLIDIREARHPLLGRDTVPLNFGIGRGYKSLIITGPNTGGKTVALKTVGLLTLMVQSGLLVPVKAGSQFAVFANVAADIGDGQSIEQSLSTFSAHIRNVVDILKHADRSTLVLIDEMASGTDPGEGVGLSIAILEELHRRGTTVVATTHFNEIKHFASVTPGFENARMEFDAETLQPLYQLRIGEAGQSYAFVIALKLGISPDIIRRSQELTGASGMREKLSSDFIPSDTEKRSGALLTGSAEKPSDVFTVGSVISTGNPSKREEGAPSERSPHPSPSKRFEIGDSVHIPYLGRTGIVYEEEDTRGNVGVMIQKQKLKINKKRLTLHIAKKELYPDDYDFDIVFESKENRKKKKLMSRKHVEGLSIIRSQGEDRDDN